MGDWMEDWTNFSIDSSGVSDDDADTVLDDDIDSDMTLTADKIWELQGTVHVLDGATLTIEAGTVIKGDAGTQGTLVISRGGKIIAVGTKDAPIVFTSTADEGDKAAGQWGGVIILGKASNFKGAEVAIEGLLEDPINNHGGTVNNDNSGELKYVRIEFGGIELSDDNEINGLTLGSVGSGTKLSYIQVNTTLDDGFEWFGGRVDAHHLVVNNAGDDMFDVDTGYQGDIDTIFGRQVVPLTSDPNGFEWDSDLAQDATPHTIVTLTNATLCGTGELGAPNFGMVLRENVRGSIDNLAFTGFDFGIDTRDNRLESDDSEKMTIENSTSWAHLDGISKDESPDGGPTDNDLGFDEAAWFIDGTGNTSEE
jgi:hypothetical protein